MAKKIEKRETSMYCEVCKKYLSCDKDKKAACENWVSDVQLKTKK